MDARAGTLPPRIRSWFREAASRENLRSELAEQARRLADVELAQAFRQACPIPGAPSDAYRNVWIDRPEGGWAVAGIRFRGLDLARPYVDLIATDVPLDGAEAVRRLAAIAAARYARFQPRHLRLLTLPPAPRWLDRLDGAFVERCTYARPVLELRNEPIPPAHARVTLRRPRGRAWSRRFHDAYAALLRSEPDQAEFASPAGDEELAAYAEGGLLFEADVDGVPAGVIAAFRGTALGMAGFGVGEILLYPEWRGTGLGSALQRALIDILPAEPGDALFGEIDTRNIPAVRAAERVGRVPVGCYTWVPIPI